MPVIKPEPSYVGAVRVRATAIDPHAGLRGHAYIAARGLDRPAGRLDIDAQHHADRVDNILAQWSPRARVLSIHTGRKHDRKQAER